MEQATDPERHRAPIRTINFASPEVWLVVAYNKENCHSLHERRLCHRSAECRIDTGVLTQRGVSSRQYRHLVCVVSVCVEQ